MTEYWYLIKRIDGRTLTVCRTRHEAVGFVARCHSLKREWTTIIPINPLVWLNESPRETIDFNPYPEGMTV